MLTYDLSKQKELFLYDKLYRCIRDDILSGTLKAGEKLPAKRRLAENLGISVITVENAYSQLMAEGYVTSRERSGFYVEAIEQTKTKKKSAREAPADRAEFPADNANPEPFPFSVWAKLMRETLLEGSERLLEAQPHEGAYALRKAIADYLYRSRGIETNPEQIIVGAGTEYIYSLLVQLFGQDKCFGVEDPGYQKTAAIYHANGAKCAYLPMDKHGVCLSSLQKSGVDILHITPTHHYPTGIITPIKRRQELLSWARERDGRFIIEDDYDSEFRFAGRPIPNLQSIDADDKVIYVNTFSKTLAHSIRISYMILPRTLLERYRKKLGFYASAVPSFEQYTLAKFIERGYFERHLNRMRTLYKKRREAILQKIETLKFRSRYEILSANSGLQCLLRVKTELSDEALIERAKAHSVRLSCLSQYSRLSEQKYDHYILLNYSKEEYKDLSFLDGILEPIP